MSSICFLLLQRQHQSVFVSWPIFGANSAWRRRVRDKESSHLCDNPVCVRSSHLMPEWAETNMLRSKCNENCDRFEKCIRNLDGETLNIEEKQFYIAAISDNFRFSHLVC